MAIQPKDLNQSNSGYGDKYRQNLQGQWEGAFLPVLSRVMSYYDQGHYSQAIEDGVQIILSRMKSIANVPEMNEAQLAAFFFVGRSYLATGDIDNATACFHLAYSQSGFEKRMLTEPYEFSKFVELSGMELQGIADEKGESYVNNFNLEKFFDSKKSSGCFIATAAYGSPFAPELKAFRYFRDEALLTSQFGKALVRLYYCASPPVAFVISKSKFLRSVTRGILLTPMLRVLKLNSAKISKGGEW